MNFICFYFIKILFLHSLVGSLNSKEIICTKKSFTCYDENRFYTCIEDVHGNRLIKGYLHTCPIGLFCDDHNEFECEEDLSREFLTEERYHFKFSGKEGRKRIIND